MEHLFTSEALMAFITLSFLEVVLGIDNIIFISLLTNKLPRENQAKARTAGIALALVLRIAMLLGITWILGLVKPLFHIGEHAVSGRDLILFLGGIFLLWKSTSEIHHKVSQDEHGHKANKQVQSFASAILQIALIDLVFSFDSILTAVGMTEHLPIMIAAVIVSLSVMLLFAGKISAYMEARPTLQILALSFLILIGTMLVAEAAHYHVPKGYIYFSVAFSLGVEMLNMRMRKRGVAS